MDILSIIRLLFIYVVAITVHEYSHAAVGHYLGDPTAKQQGRLTLNPMAHIDPLTTLALPVILILAGSPVIFGAARPVPFNPYMVRYAERGAALIALAGPMSNFLVAIIVAVVVRLVPSLGLAGGSLLILMIQINIALGLFNLIPIPPLDGSRVVYAFVPEAVREAMERFERMGPIAILVIFLVAFPFISPYLGTVTNAVTRFLLGVS